MTISGRDVLLLGRDFQSSQILIDQLRRSGFRCHFVNSMRAASQLLRSMRIDVVLSDTHLPDGTGLGLAAVLTGLPVTAFLCWPVEDSCLWLPVIEDGKPCLGLPALRPSEFVMALDEMAQCLTAEPLIDEPVVKTRSCNSPSEREHAKDEPVRQS